MSEEIQASGMDAEVGELDENIADLIGKEDAAIESDKDGKKKPKLIKRQQKNYGLRLWNGLETLAQEVEMMERGEPKRKEGEAAVIQQSFSEKKQS